MSGGVEIGEGAIVRNSVILSDVRVESGATVDYSIIDSESVIGSGVVVGDPNAGKDSITVIAKGSFLSASEEKNGGERA